MINFLNVFDFSNLPQTWGQVWEYAAGVFEKIITYIDQAIIPMLEVIGKVNTIDLADNSLITQFVGNIRYIIGDGLFLPMMALVSISYGIAVWYLILKLVQAIKDAWANRIKIKIGP